MRHLVYYAVIAALIFLSCVYLHFVFSLLFAVTDVSCVDGGGTKNFAIGKIGQITVKCQSLGVNEVGDYFAGSVSLLATFWLVIAFVWQAFELSFQRKEFAETNRIADVRAKSEDVWRKVEYYEKMREKFTRNANEIQELKCRIQGLGAPKMISVLSDAEIIISNCPQRYSSSDYDPRHDSDISRLNSLLDICRAVSKAMHTICLLYTSPSPRDKRQSRMPSSA